MNGSTMTNDTQVVKTAGNIAYVTSFKTTFVELMNHVRQCQTDEEAKGAWTMICNIELGLLGQILKDEDLQQELQISQKSLNEAQALCEKWMNGEITRIEKTRYSIFENDGGSHIYRMLWDSTPAECLPQDLEKVEGIVEREKISQMVQRMIQFSGECLHLIMGVGLITLDDIVATPFKPEENYSMKTLDQDMTRRGRLYERP